MNNSVRYTTYKWTIWGLLALSFVVVFFHRYSTGVVAEDFARDLGLSPERQGAQLGNLAAMYFWAYALMQIPAGVMADYIGPRKTTAYGMLLAGIGSTILGYAVNIQMAYIGRLLVGIGVSGVFISILKIQAVWFKKEEFPSISGWTSLIGNIGGVLATYPFALLVGFIGWQMSFKAMGVVSVLLFVLTLLLVKDSPQDVGLKGPNDQEIMARPQGSVVHGVLKVLLNKHTWPNFIILFCLMGTIVSFSGLWGIPYLTQVYNIGRETASLYVLVLTVGVMVGSLIVGYLAKYVGSVKKIILSGSIIFTTIWGYKIFLAGGKPSLTILPVLYFLMGVSAVSFILSFTNVKNVNNPGLSGTATSIANVGGFLGAALLNNLIGVVLDIQGQSLNVAGTDAVASFQFAFAIYFVMGLIAIVATILQSE
ncbi:MFS transporter [Proteinivorax tanatarense]|uniref:Lysosomal dipeptide transporter MFSD1 n=1 Tax=Proteinivorax tanatarense TaxID=1260629 RepID=A0AAU7VPC4_9FIRM